MRYVLLVYDHPDALADLSEAERQAVYSEYESALRDSRTRRAQTSAPGDGDHAAPPRRRA
jgi:hypothetical protein